MWIRQKRKMRKGKEGKKDISSCVEWDRMSNEKVVSEEPREKNYIANTF